MPPPSIFTNVINSYLPEPHASLLNGIIFGVNLKTTKQFYEQLKIVGLLHLVVLSGMNITLLASVITSVTIFLGRWISTLITVLIVILFILFVGIQAPILRAGVMGILTLVAIMYEKRTFVFYTLLLSLLITFMFRPAWLTTVSLQLSYAATLGIVLFGQTRLKPEESKIGKLKNYIIEELRLSLAAQLFSAPIIFLYFKQISFISPIANVLVSFTITPIMIFGFLTAILGKIHFSLGLIPSYISYALLSYVVFIIETLSKFTMFYLKF